MRRLQSGSRLLRSRRFVVRAVWVAGLMAGSGAHADDLHEAARLGDSARAHALIASGSGADLDRPDRHGMTPLLWSVQANDLDTARVLLAAGADANLANRYEITPLWLAATNRSASMVGLLLDHRADATLAMPHGETALMAAARAGDAASVRLLVNAGSDPNAQEHSLGESALMWAAAEGHVDAIRALIDGGADPDLASKILNLAPMDWLQIGMVSTVLPVGGWAPMLYAARENRPNAALALIESGADPNIQDPDGLTALHIAIMNEHYDLAVLLLESGADPNVSDRTGMSPLYGVADMSTLGSVIGRPPVPRLDEHGPIDAARALLRHGADPDAALAGPILARHHGFPDRALSAGATPLMRAVKGHDIELIRLLIDSGASPEARQNSGATVLHMMAAARAANSDEAAERERSILDLLLAAGADIDAPNNDGQTPLHSAAQSGNAKLVERLVERGARLDATDSAGRTAFGIVSAPGRGQNAEIAELLQRLAGE